jgi:hypothetical protein
MEDGHMAGKPYYVTAEDTFTVFETCRKRGDYSGCITAMEILAEVIGGKKIYLGDDLE